jgi:uncharacterized metal-binding protein YceD (DUF177 family)
MKYKNPQTELELSRPLRAEKVSANGVEEKIVATEKERAALTTRFDLLAINALEAKLHIVPKHAGTIFEVMGSFKADVTQRCVATLEPLTAHIEQPIEANFGSPFTEAGGAIERSTEEDDLEPMVNGIMDLGELVAQHLGLALDPYPRKADVPPVEAEFGVPIIKTSPFAKLVTLKDRKKD